MQCRKLIDRLAAEKRLNFEQWRTLWREWKSVDQIYAAGIARDIAVKNFGHQVYIRGIVEFANYCGNDCFYCGIRKSNLKVKRYCMDSGQVIACCRTGYENNIRTFVLQSGEATRFDAVEFGELIRRIKSEFPDCAVTLSLGELSFEEYALLKAAGADRYLLRQESACEVHYRKMHPPCMSLSNRIKCLRNLKKLQYQTGCGFMTGAPFQSPESLAEDMLFIADLQPEMVGIGPFIPHADTPFGRFPAGTLEQTLLALSLCRIMLPEVLLPATTALGTLQPDGREQGILSGANVIMPNLTPASVQADYTLYNNKQTADVPVNDIVEQWRSRLSSIGYTLAAGRGDFGEKIC